MTALKNFILVGLGSPHGDDQVGWQVVERLNSGADANSLQVQLAKSPIDILDALTEQMHLVVVDACIGSGPPGSIHHLKWPSESLRIPRGSGTHDFDLNTVLSLAAKLDRLPQKIDLWMIEAESTSPGSGLSEIVKLAIPELVDHLVKLYLDGSTLGLSSGIDRVNIPDA